MKRKKLLKALTDLLDAEGRKQRKHHDELKILLKKLAKKEIELEDRMQSEKDKYKQKRLVKELEIVRAQHAKGEAALENMEKS